MSISLPEEGSLSDVIEDPLVRRLALGRPIIAPPPKRHSWKNSRLVVNADGTTTQVLYLLAEAKFGTWDTVTQYPYYLNKRWDKETLSNVGLATRAETGRGNSLGVPSGTKEYSKRWREANPERFKSYQKKYRATRLKKLKELRDVNEKLRKQEAYGQEIAPEAKALQQRLAKLLQPKQPKQPD